MHHIINWSCDETGYNLVCLSLSVDGSCTYGGYEAVVEVPSVPRPTQSYLHVEPSGQKPTPKCGPSVHVACALYDDVVEDGLDACVVRDPLRPAFRVALLA